MTINNAFSLGYNLMKQHGLIANGWSLEFDNAVKRFGQCRYRTKVISLSKKLVMLNDESQVKDVILHEIAHALTPGHHHNYTWKMMCVKIGANPERCYDSSEVETPTLKYSAICGGCGKEHQRAKAPDTTRSIACKCQSYLPWSLKKKLIYQARY